MNPRRYVLPLSWILILLSCIAYAAPAFSRTFYVDLERGSNANDGTTPMSAWRTPDVINTASLVAGDTILFRKGMVWRGYVMSLSAKNLLLGNYGGESAASNLPILSAASPLDYERIINADLDIHITDRNSKNATFPGWQVQTKSPESIVASKHTRNGSGVCANLIYSGNGPSPRIINTTPAKIAAGMPVSYIFWARVEKGGMYVRITNHASKKYLAPDRKWSTKPVMTVAIEGSDAPEWKKIRLDFDNDVLGQLMIEFISLGNVLIDELTFKTNWVQHTTNIFKRALVTSKGNAIYGVFQKDIRLEGARSKSDIGPERRWYWDGEERLFYLYHNDDAASLENAPILVDRSHYKLLELNGNGQTVDGIGFEKAFEGIRIGANNITISNSEIRQMSAYSIQMLSQFGKEALNNIKITNNRISNSGNGPYLVRTNDSLIDKNIIFDIGYKGTKADMEAIPVMIGSRNIIEYNQISDVVIGIDLWGTQDKAGVSNESSHNIIRYNKIHNADKYGIVLGGEAINISMNKDSYGEPCASKKMQGGCAFRGYVFSNLVHHNVIQGSGQSHNEGAAIRITKTPMTSQNYVFNNTLYDNRISVSGEPSAGGFILANNVSLMPRAGHLSFPGDKNRRDYLRSSVLSHNVYYPGDMYGEKNGRVGSSYLFKWDSRSYSDFTRFKKYSGQEIRGGWAMDPQLQCPECGDFSPRHTSPLIGQGTSDLGMGHEPITEIVVQDIDGNPVGTSQPIDIGAYEYTGGLMNRQ